MSEKIIRVPKGWPVTYCDMDGKTQKVNLTTNKEYRISINNGAKVYPIITVAKVQKNAAREMMIIPKLQLDPGYENPIHLATCGDIPVAQITSIEEVSTGYVSERRSKKTMNTNGKTPFTFAFDKRDGGEYRIAIYSGEFVALSVKDDRPNAKSRSRNIYCTFNTFDEETNEVVVTRFIAVNNVRQITENYRVPLDDLYAIFRYRLEVKENEPESEKDADPAPTEEATAEAPAEKTEESEKSE